MLDWLKRKMNRNLGSKIIFQFILLGVVPVIALLVGLSHLIGEHIEESAYQKLESVESVKKAAISRHFENIKNQLITFSKNDMTISAAREFKSSFQNHAFESTESTESMRRQVKNFYTNEFTEEFKKKNSGKAPNVEKHLEELSGNTLSLQHSFIANPAYSLGSKHRIVDAEDGSEYSGVHAKYHSKFAEYLERFGYYDIFIVDPETGHIVYSVFKEVDYATSLIDGPLKDSNIAKVFRDANQLTSTTEFAVTDYGQYFPSYGAPASFLGSPIYDNGEKVAVAIFQVSLDQINAVMGDRAGMGRTGETFLVGEDLLLRSNSHIDAENRTVESSYRNPDKAEITMEGISSALRGDSAQIIADNYLEQPSLIRYTPIEFFGKNWALISHITLKEAFAFIYFLNKVEIAVVIILLLWLALVGLNFERKISKPLRSSINSLNHSVASVTEGSDQLAVSAAHLSDIANQQASAIEETAASLEEIGATVRNNVEQSEKSSSVSGKVKLMTDKGNQSVGQLTKAMEDIVESNETVRELVKIINEIGLKTGIIDEIVFQTKLLSFNASVEAERAGEHGRGFSVVAKEVGNLAQMSGNAASEIATMVKSGLQNAEEISRSNEKRVELGQQHVDETAKILGEIATLSQSLLQQSRQIENSSREQANGITQVNDAMTQIDQATHQNALTSVKTAKASEGLAKQATTMKNLVRSLGNLVGGVEAVDKRDSGKTDKSAHIIQLAKKQKTEPDVSVRQVGQAPVVSQTAEDQWRNL